MADILVVQSKVRELVKNQDANMAGDFPDELSRVLENTVASAVKRAKSNGRKTVRAVDL